MNEKNKIVLENLENTYCRIKRSKIEGVGIFAIRDIPKGTDPFYGCRPQKWKKVKLSELQKLDKNAQQMISAFFAMNKNEEFLIPECGLNGIDISFFLNMTKNPNVRTTDDGTNFVTIKNIKKGQELTTSYADYDERYKTN